MEYIEKEVSWLHTKIKEKGPKSYFIFDCPGQVELYTHHRSMRNMLQLFTGDWGLRLCAVHLVDSHACSDPGKYISALMTSLSTMMLLELPHVNVLSKIDLVEAYGKLRFNLDYYTEVMDLDFLLEGLSDDPFLSRFKKMNEALVELVQDFSLVQFQPLTVNNKKSMAALLRIVDKAAGYLYTSSADGEVAMSEAVFSSRPFSDSEVFRAQTEYMHNDIEDELEHLRLEKEKEDQRAAAAAAATTTTAATDSKPAIVVSPVKERLRSTQSAKPS
jgi:hypothetical protein